MVSTGEPFANMTTRAYEALRSVGVDIAGHAREGYTFAALVVVGSHCRTMYELYDGDPAHLSLKLNGKAQIPLCASRLVSTIQYRSQWSSGNTLACCARGPRFESRVDKNLCFHENHCDTQLWARAAH